MIRTTKSPTQDMGLLALRLGVGGVLFAHGAQKLFGWFGGHGIKGEAGVFEQMGFRPARASAVAAGLGEAAGGSLIVLGLATPVAGSIAAGTMVAAASVHTPSGFFAASGGYEYPALLGVSAAALSFTGPGDWSLDALLRHRLNRPWMATVGVLASSVASLAIVRLRHKALPAQRGARAVQVEAETPQMPVTAPGSAPPTEGEA
jgi:putative oxidoreductase